jgi:hypothetical protein
MIELDNVEYIIGSHNSWSYLKTKKWWLRPFAFMAKCQNIDILTQFHTYKVRCFDLRVRFNKRGEMVISHGFMEYDIKQEELFAQLKQLNAYSDVAIRVIHEARTSKQYTTNSVQSFRNFCDYIKKEYPKIKFWCGRNLYNWEYDYKFKDEPSCEENYSSVKAPKLIDDWWPWLYAKRNNKEIIKNGSDKDILLIDFVNIR